MKFPQLSVMKKSLKKRWTLPVVVLAMAIVVCAAVFFFSNSIFTFEGFKKHTIYDNTTILFYGNGCSHCVKVDNFIAQNNLETKFTFARLEVFEDATNADILADRAQTCGLDYHKIGVPLLWDDESKICVIGDSDIIAFFKARLSPEAKK